MRGIDTARLCGFALRGERNSAELFGKNAEEAEVLEIGIIGTGVIASAVVRGLVGRGHRIVVSERSSALSSMLAAEFEDVRVAENQIVLEQSDVVFLGLMAEHAAQVLADLTFRPEQQVISLMAGAALQRVQELVAPAKAVAVMIPFPGIALGGSPVMVRGNPTVIERLFGDQNEVFSLPDDAELDAYLSAQAVLSPAVRMVQDAARWLGARVQDPAQGEAFLRVLVGSSLLTSETEPLLEALNTPGGYNARLREHMVDAGMSAEMKRGLDKLSE